MDSPPNFWTPVVTDAFFHRLCAAGTHHRNTYNTHEKKLHFLAGRIGLTSALFAEVNPLDYEQAYMWGWTVPLTPEERSKMELFRVKN
jgi:hypothetical protein